MNAEDFYKMYKKGKRMENEYFIAVDKASLFEMMEAYAEIKLRNQGELNTKGSFKKTSQESTELLKHN